MKRLDRARHRADDPEPVRPDPDLLGRWIAARVLDLGWTPERYAVCCRKEAGGPCG